MREGLLVQWSLVGGGLQIWSLSTQKKGRSVKALLLTMLPMLLLNEGLFIAFHCLLEGEQEGFLDRSSHAVLLHHGCMPCPLYLQTVSLFGSCPFCTFLGQWCWCCPFSTTAAAIEIQTQDINLKLHDEMLQRGMASGCCSAKSTRTNTMF